mmetsp:Transcript_36907/g.42942  ORF Transcript_36907/g.42942 Transcript_36907/m.42942 type:complete len:155 (-) Transcript_36907:648-1112(-)
MRINDDNESTNPTATTATTAVVCLKKIVCIILPSLITFIIIDCNTTKYTNTYMDEFLTWTKQNRYTGIFAFIGVFVISTVLFVPGSILTIGGGFIFVCAFGFSEGLIVGTIAVFTGGSAGAIISFLLGRYLMRDRVVKLVHKYPLAEAFDKGKF